MQKIIKHIININSRISNYIENNSLKIAILFSVSALAVSLFNSYQIKNSYKNVIVDSNNGSLPPEEIIKEIPKDIPVLGNINAKLTIIEFGDYQCPFCGQFHNNIFPEIKKNYIDTGKAKFVYLDFAFLGQESKDAVNAVYCANEQGMYWQYHNKLFLNQSGENKGAFAFDKLSKLASNLGMNSDKFNECLKSEKYNDLIEKELILGQKFGVSGTPALLIGKSFLRGVNSVPNLMLIINKQL